MHRPYELMIDAHRRRRCCARQQQQRWRKQHQATWHDCGELSNGPYPLFHITILDPCIDGMFLGFFLGLFLSQFPGVFLCKLRLYGHAVAAAGAVKLLLRAT